jgi:predicted SAM-dependent methyltransferase
MELEEYITFLQRSGHAAPTDSALRRSLKALLPAPLRGALKGGLTRVVEPYSRIRVRRISARAAPLRIHLGSGASPKPGWVNVDLVGAKVDLWWDVARRLPFGDHEVDAVFHEHLLEHLSLEQGLALTRECRRVLKEEGTLRIVVPDCQGYLASYANGGEFLEEAKPGRPTQLLAASEVFLRHGHRSAYDFETLALVCRKAGFDTLKRSSFGCGRLQPCPDSEHRRHESLYVEAAAAAPRETPK